MTEAELIDYLATELPNARRVRVAALNPDIIMQLDDRSVRISVNCGDDDCLAEAAYRNVHRHRARRAGPHEPRSTIYVLRLAG